MIVAYLRVSTSRQHVENQQGEITRYALSRGMEIGRWKQEIVSGKTDRLKRKLGKLLSRLKRGDVLIVTELSRLSRSLHEIMLIMKHCVDNGVVVHSTKEGYMFNDSLNSKVLSFAFGLAAEIEHKLISQRTREAMAVSKAQGKEVGRKKGSGSKQRLLEEHKQEISAALAAGRSVADICKEYKVSYNTYYLFMKIHPEVKYFGQRNECNHSRY